MWKFNQRRTSPSSTSYSIINDIPQLTGGRAYFAVIDVEALVMGKMDIVEQVAIVLVDVFGKEVLGEKHMIFQPMNAEQLAQSYHLDPHIVQKGIDGYTLVTRDNYVHDNPYVFERWGPVRKRIVNICQRYAMAVYAKGIALEYRVFYGELPFWDLAWWGAPKYPGDVHDPLNECRFFSQYIPDLVRRPTYIC